MAGKVHMKNGLHIDNDGIKRWYFNGLLHREDGPATVWPSGEKFWYKSGAFHREDGPAIEISDGSACWFLNGVHLGDDVSGFWALWNMLSTEQQNNVELHRWLIKYSA